MDEKPEMSGDDEQRLETREVEVHDPHLSDHLNEKLTEELQDVIGAQEVRVPKDRPHPSLGEAPEHSPWLSLASSNWLMMMIAGFSGLVVLGIVVSAVTGSWWFVALAVVLDVIGITVIATVVLRMTSRTERPAAVVVAEMGEEGVASPEQHFGRIADEFREAEDSEGEHRTKEAREDPHAAAAEQQSASTQTSGPSEAVGP